MSWSARPVMPAGHIITAADVTAILDQIASLTAPGWTSYTPAWTSTGTAPAIGNATVVGKYRQPSGGDVVDAYFTIIFGSSSTYGTSEYRFSLPVNAHAELVGYTIGDAYALDSGTQEYGGLVKVETASTIRVVKDAGGTWGQLVPFTWTTNDRISVNVRYRPA